MSPVSPFDLCDRIVLDHGGLGAVADAGAEGSVEYRPGGHRGDRALRPGTVGLQRELVQHESGGLLRGAGDVEFELELAALRDRDFRVVPFVAEADEILVRLVADLTGFDADVVLVRDADFRRDLRLRSLDRGGGMQFVVNRFLVNEQRAVRAEVGRANGAVDAHIVPSLAAGLRICTLNRNIVAGPLLRAAETVEGDNEGTCRIAGFFFSALVNETVNILAV